MPGRDRALPAVLVEADLLDPDVLDVDADRSHVGEQPGQFAGLVADQACDSVKRVKEKMRMQLHLERI